MKRFLLSNPENKEWIEAQEKRRKSEDDAGTIAKLVRREMYPALHRDSIESPAASSSSGAPKEIIIEARQRQNHRVVMQQLLKTVKPISADKEKQKQNCTLYRTNTWEQKAKAIFFYMHPSLGHLDPELTCSLFSINLYTFTNWIRQPKYYGKWVPYAENLKVADVLPSVPAKYRDNYAGVDTSSKVNIDPKFRKSGTKQVYVSAASSSSRQGARKAASKSANVTYIRKDTKTVGSGRKVKYPEQETCVIEAVVYAWETGNPMSKSAVYDFLLSKFAHENEADQTEFEKKMGLLSGHITPALSQWLLRVLERHRFSVRKESISQTVPKEWLQICLDSTALIRETMRSAGVTRLVNADEMFIQYYPKETHLIAPTNAKRVGSNRAEDGKKGCTVVVACEMFQSTLLAPFIVMTGQPDGTLSRRFSNWEGSSKVTFQPKHWMDKPGCCKFLDWLSSCFPGEKIGLIWDAATSHLSEDVKEKADELNITLGDIPAGCTSLIQICDLIANKPLKQAFKKRYVSWKIRSDPGPGGKYKVDRRDIITWLEESMEEVNSHMAPQSQIAKAFNTYGQDFRSSEQSKFTEYLAKHEENGVYRALLSNQRSIDME